MLDTASLIILIVGGAAVLASYFWVFRSEGASYLSPANPYWLGYSNGTIQALVLLQVLAVVGFFLFVVPWVVISPPEGGLGARKGALPATLALFLAAATLWAPAMKEAVKTRSRAHSNTWKGVGAGALFVCAIASILFVAMAAEEDSPRWYVLLGTILFAGTTVLGDGVAYPARMLTRDIREV